VQARPLTRVDVHAVEVAAGRERVWEGVLAEVRGGGTMRGLGATLLGCRERRAEGPLDREGSTLIGFRVADVAVAERLALVGEHRFSRYALTFDIAERDAGSGALLRATTDAWFVPIYRALVVGSGMHDRLMRAMVERIRRRAERGVSSARPAARRRRRPRSAPPPPSAARGC
jgi:hypothetical protein